MWTMGDIPTAIWQRVHAFIILMVYNVLSRIEYEAGRQAYAPVTLRLE